MPLRLHVAPHQAEAEPGLAVLGDEPGDDRVKRPLARLQVIGMGLIEGKEASPVLEREAQPCRDITADRLLCNGPNGRSAAATRRSLPRPSQSKAISRVPRTETSSREIIVEVQRRVASGKPRVVSGDESGRLLLATRASTLFD
jgi:hypothetical protein